MSHPTRIVVVGGGLAGMAAALALAQQGIPVSLFEARRNLGGRASSFRDVDSEQAIDFCQHVSLGCCTNLADFCQRAGIADLFDRFRSLHFVGPDHKHYKVAGSAWLPAPLHMLPLLWGLQYLTIWERFAIARSLYKLARSHDSERSLGAISMRTWLESEGHSPNAVEGFWKVILVSALSEDLSNISVPAARKVFVEGFMAAPAGYELLVPRIPLGEMYGKRLQQRMESCGIQVLTGAIVSEIGGMSDGVFYVKLQNGTIHGVRGVVLATPWRHAISLVAQDLQTHFPDLTKAAELQSAPITGIHLWFDRPITDLPHAVLVGKLSHWLFQPGFGTETSENSYYYQVVISASRELSSLSKHEIIAKVVGELEGVFPTVSDAHLKRAVVVTERHAVFSPRPGIGTCRPSQQTAIPNLFLAGDWTTTGWPATMEGAVRSGYLAAERVCDWLGTPQKYVVPDLPRGWLAKAMIR